MLFRSTTSASGSYSRLNCKCDPGYSCTYYKRIQAIVTLNATVYDFNNNVKGVRTAFIAAMAAAANVSTQHVSINGVVARTAPAGSRRLLSVRDVMDEPSIAAEFASLPQGSTDQKPGPVARSLLSALDDAGIRVFATVADAGRLNHLEKHVEASRPGLFISHRWDRTNTVSAAKVPG